MQLGSILLLLFLLPLEHALSRVSLPTLEDIPQWWEVSSQVKSQQCKLVLKGMDFAVVGRELPIASSVILACVRYSTGSLEP